MDLSSLFGSLNGWQKAHRKPLLTVASLAVCSGMIGLSRAQNANVPEHANASPPVTKKAKKAKGRAVKGTLPPKDLSPVASDGGLFFYSQGRKNPLTTSNDWVAVQVDPNTTLEAASTQVRARGGAVLAKDPAIRYDNKNIAVFRVASQASVDARSDLKAQLDDAKGVRRAVRVFKNGNLPPIVETDEFLIQFQPGVSRTQIDALLKAQGAVVVRPLGSYAPNGWVARVLDPTVKGTTEVANALYVLRDVIFSHPDFIWPKQKRYVPNDTLYPQQWHHQNIESEQAWDLTRGSSTVTIAVLDDGFNMSHEDFASGKFTAGWDYVGNDNDPSPGTTSSPPDDHGTACAGLAAGTGNNSKGISGVAPNSRLMGVRMLGSNSGPSMEAAAIAHAKNNGAWVISNSWGPTDGLGVSQPIPDNVNTAINDAVNNGRGGKGCVVIWAAGNGNESADLDGYASHPGVLSVAATQSNDIRAPYSDFGTSVDVCAPGGSAAGDMVTIDRMGSAGYDSSNYTTNFNGTSAAAPVVAGAAALILAKEPNLDELDVRQRLIDTADFVGGVTYNSSGHNNQYGYGRINIRRALAANDSVAPNVSISSPTDGATVGSIHQATGLASDSGGNLLQIRVALSDASARYYNWRTNAFDSTTFTLLNHAKEAAGTATWTAQLPNLAAGYYEVHAQSVDYNDNESDWAKHGFTVNPAATSVTFDPIKENDIVLDLSQIGGTVGSDVNSVTFQILENTPAGSPDRFWSGTGWVDADASGNGPSLNAKFSNGRWSPAVGVTLPTRNQMRAGPYTLGAKATNLAGDYGTASVHVTRSATDSTAPIVTIDSPTAGQLVTTSALPAIKGTAKDPETGIASVTIELRRVTGGNYEYWSGTNWSSTVTNLPTNFTPTSTTAGNWSAPATGAGAWSLPSSGNLTNSSYQIVATAKNNETPQGSGGSSVAFSREYRAVYTWTAGSNSDGIQGNDDHYWGNPANWSPEGVPSVDDIAIVNINDTVRSTVSRTVYGFQLNNGALDFDNASHSLTITKSGLWKAGTFNKKLIITAGTSLTISGTGAKGLGDNTVIDNAGTITWSGASIFCSGYNGWASINNQNGATFELAGDGTPFTTSYGSTFNNAPTAKLIKSGGTTSTTLSGWTFNNSGELRSNVATLAYNSTLNLNDGGTITGAGKHNLAGGTLNLTGTTTANGTTFTMSGGTLNSTGTAANFASTANGIWNWQGGTINGTIANAGAFNISGTSQKTFGDNTVFNNTGKVTWTGGAIFCSGYNGPMTFNNKSGGTMDVSTSAGFTTSYGSKFNNASGATFSHSGTGTSSSDWAFNNDGLVQVNGGTLTLNAGGQGNGRFQALANTLLKFTGGTHTLNTPVCFGAGKFQVAGGTVTLSGQMTLGDTASPSTLELLTGTLNGSGTIAGANAARSTLNWQGGTIGGSQVWASSLQTKISDPATDPVQKTIADSTTINNDGPVTLSGTGKVFCSGYNGTSTFNNRSGATFTLASAGAPFSTSYGSAFNNQSGARLIKTATGTVTLNGWGFSNVGEIQAASNYLDFTSTLNLGTGTTFTGSGTTRFNGTVNANDSFSAVGPVELAGGSFNGGATTAYSGQTFNWTGGSLNGQLTLNPGCLFTVSGAADKTLGDNAVLNNKGTVAWKGAGKIVCSGYNGWGTINNLSGATFDVAAAGVPFATSYGSSFNNQAGARLIKSATGIATLNGWTYNNASEVQVLSDALEFTSTLNLNSGSTFTGAGLTRFNGTVNTNAPFSAVGPVELAGNNFNGAATAAFSGPKFTWLAGNINGQLTLNAGSLLNVSGTDTKTLGDNTILNNKGTITWTGPGPIACSGYNGWGTINNLSGGLFNLAAGGTPFTTSYGSSFNNQVGAQFVKTAGAENTVFSGWTFNNGSWDGTTLVAGGKIKSDTGILEFNAPFNLNGGTFEGAGQHLVSGGTLTSRAVSTIVNSTMTMSGGTLSALTGGGTNTATIATTGSGNFNWTGGTISGTLATATGAIVSIYGTADKALADGSVFNNKGTVTWSAGNISCSGYNGPATFNNLSGGVFNARSTASLTTSYGSTFSNAGTLDLGKNTLNCGWSFGQTSTGKLLSSIGSATSFGKLGVGGNLTLGGIISPVLTASYLPPMGTPFKVVTHGNRTGTFAKVTTLGTTARFFTAQYNASDVTLLTQQHTVSVKDVKVTEGDTGSVTTNFVVFLSAAQPGAVKVNYATVNGTAVSGKDYTPVSGTLLFAAGETSKTVTVSVLGDLLDEDEETFTLKLSTPINIGLGDGIGSASIVDNDGAPSLSITDASVTEGDSGTVNANFTVKLSAISGKTVSLKYATANDTAGATDFTAKALTLLSFAPGETSKTIAVAVKGDLIDEVDETFNVLLSSGVNATITDTTGVGTIVDNDTSSITVADASMTEGNTGTAPLNFIVKLSVPNSRVVTVKYQTTAAATNPATAGVDYTALPVTTLTFAAGETSKTVSVSIAGDLVDEDDEGLRLSLSSPTVAVLGDGTGEGVIVDNDSAPSLSVTDASLTEGATGTTSNLTLTVKLSASSTKTVTVNYATANGTATAGSDYTAKTGSLSFAPGELSKTVLVPVTGDAVDEVDETFNLGVSTPVNATISDSTGVGTITDDDTSTITVNSPSLTEGNSGSASLNFTVKLSVPNSRAVTVSYKTGAATTDPALAGTDYVTVPTTTLTFAPGETSKTVGVTVNGDTIDEVNEQFNLLLGNAVNATIGGGTGVGTILDDDASPSLKISDATITEGNSGTKTVTLTVTMSAVSGRTVTTTLATANGTATAGSDYTAQTGTLSFAPGQISKTISVVIAGDAVSESNEQFTVNLTGSVGATRADSTGVVTITNDDSAGGSAASGISASDASDSANSTADSGSGGDS